MPYRKNLQRGYPWAGAGLSSQALNQMADAGSRRFRARYPLRMRQDGNIIEFSHETPHRQGWFLIASHKQVRDYIEASFQDSAPLISAMVSGNCEGVDVPESWLSAWAFPLQFLSCSNVDSIDYSKPTRLYFPAMTAPVTTCQPVRAVFNYDSNFWESTYRGPDHLAVSSTFTVGQQGPSNADVYCLNASGQMVDSGIDIDLYFDWTPPAGNHTGNFIAEWHECDCRWRATCCQGETIVVEGTSCGETNLVTRNPTTGDPVSFAETSVGAPMNLTLVNSSSPASRNFGVVSIIFTGTPPAALNFSALEKSFIGGLPVAVPTGVDGTVSLYGRGGDIGTGDEMFALEHAVGGAFINPYAPNVLAIEAFSTPMTSSPGTVSIFPEVETIYQTWLTAPVTGTFAELEGGFPCVRDNPIQPTYHIFEFAVEITEIEDNQTFSLTDMIWTGI